MNACFQCNKAYKRPQDLASHYTKTKHIKSGSDQSTQANSEWDDEIDFTAPISEIEQEPVYTTRIRTRRPVIEIIPETVQINTVTHSLPIDNKHSYILKVANTISTYYHKYRSICQLLQLDAKYERQQIGSYNKEAVLYYNKEISNEYLNHVLEIDFDSFYPYSFIINKDNVYPDTLVQLFRAMYDARMYYNSINDTAAESSVKSLQCQLAGCLGSAKDNSKGIQDFKSHSYMMQQTRTEITRLREYVEQTGFEVYSIQTDAVFVNCQTQENVDKVIAFMSNFETQYKYKFKHHAQLYHFINKDKYLSLVDGKPCIKGFVGKTVIDGKLIKQYLEPYVLRFMNKDQMALFDAMGNIDKLPDIDCQCILQSIGALIKDLPELASKLSQLIHLRVETLVTSENQQYTVRKHYWIKPEHFDQWIQQFDRSKTAIHEIIAIDTNWLVLDLDHLKAATFAELQKELLKVNNYICADSRIRLIQEDNTKSIRYKYTYRKIDNESYSVHMTYNVQLPLATQRSIACEMNENIYIEADDQIYCIGKSLRLPGCIKITKNVIEDKVLLMEDNTNIKDLLFTVQSKQSPADKAQFSNYWLNQTQTAIDMTTRFDFTTAKDQITIALKQQFNLDVTDIKIKDKWTVQLTVLDTNVECVICKRLHAYCLNRTNKLSIWGAKGVYQLQCGRSNKRIPHMSAIVIDKQDPISIKQISTLNPKFITNGTRQVARINRQFLIVRGSTYIIPDKHCVCIISDMGTGKSEIVQSQITQHKRVLLVSTRKVFTLAMQNRFKIEDEQIYTNSNGLTQTSICQLESLGKAVDQQWDVVVLDEIQSILQQITSTKMNAQTSKLSALLVDILRRADRVLVLDAQLEQSTIDWLIVTLSKFTVDVIENKYQAFKGNKLTIVRKQKECDIYNNIIESVVQRYNSKQKTWVIVSSVTDLQNALKCINDRCPDIKLKVFCGLGESTTIDNQYNGNMFRLHKTENKEFFEDISKFKDLDVVIHSAAITSGLDVTGCGFDYVIGCIKTGQFSPQQLLQAIHRSRDVKEVLLFSQSLVIPSAVSKCYLQTLSHNSHIITGEGVDTSQIQALIQLSKQYKNDLNNLGLQYVTESCKRMGYVVDELMVYNKPFNEQFVGQSSYKTTVLTYLFDEFMKSIDSVVSWRYKEKLDDEFQVLLRQAQQLAHQQITGQLGTRGKALIDNKSLTGLSPHMQIMVDLCKYTYMMSHKDLMERAPETFNQYSNDIYKGNWKRVVQLLMDIGNTAFRSLMESVTDCKHHRSALEQILQIDGQKERNKAIVQWGLEDAKHASRLSKVIDYIELHKLDTKTLLELRTFAESRDDFPNNCYRVLGIHADDQVKQVTVNGKRIKRRLLIKVQSNELEHLDIVVLKTSPETK